MRQASKAELVSMLVRERKQTDKESKTHKKQEGDSDSVSEIGLYTQSEFSHSRALLQGLMKKKKLLIALHVHFDLWIPECL